MKTFNAGTLTQRQAYKSFSPHPINFDFDWNNKRTAALYGETMRCLGELNAYSKLIPNVDFFIHMSITKESTKSSMIEGTQTEMDEAILPEGEIATERIDDWQEVQNSIRSINFSIDALKRLPLTMRLIKPAHKILLTHVRGKHKQPGEIRQSQNWIGGDSLSNAFYVPPTADELPDCLTDIERFWHNQTISVPAVIKIAIFHYQFETIHPFLDGNGRIGRLLITLQLIDSGILSSPTLSISDFLATHKEEYFRTLTAVREKNDLTQWIEFFLTAIVQSAQKAIMISQKSIALTKEYEQKIITLSSQPAKSAQKLLQAMFAQPIMSIPTIQRTVDISYNSAGRLAQRLLELGMLTKTKGISRKHLFVLAEYLALFSD